MIYVNNVGLGAEFSYIGISKVFNKNGDIIAKANAFKEELLIYNSFDKICNLPVLSNEFYNYQNQEKFSLDYTDDLERTYKTLVFGIKE